MKEDVKEGGHAALAGVTNTIKHNPGSPWRARHTHLSPPAIHRSSHPPPSRHIAEHRSSIAHNVRYIAIATWEDWIVGGLKVQTVAFHRLPHRAVAYPVRSETTTFNAYRP